MTRDEERLAEVLRLALPPSDGVAFEDVVRQVRRRRATRVAVLGVVGATALVAAGVVLTAQGAGPHARLTPGATVDLTGAVPWTDAPAQPYVAPTTAPTTATTVARPCTAADVAVRDGGQEGATGHTFRVLLFRNTSTSPCLLQGYPGVTATDAGRPDVVATQGGFFPDTQTADMPPGGETRLVVETESLCAARPGGGGGLAPYPHLDITLPSGSGVGFTSTDGFDITCGLRVGQFFVEQQPAPEPHDPLSDLTATLELPDSVQPGTTLVYVVGLTNPTGQAITLDRCPSYVEVATGAKEAYQLSCGVASPIAAGATERFEMRLGVPVTASGQLALRWSLAAPYDVSATGTVAVR